MGDVEVAKQIAERETIEQRKLQGLAEAEVLSAKYKAKAQNKEIFLAEVQRDIATEMYRNLRDFKVEMPQNVITGAGGPGGAGKLTSNLDVITGFGALGVMKEALNLGNGANGRSYTNA